MTTLEKRKRLKKFIDKMSDTNIAALEKIAHKLEEKSDREYSEDELFSFGINLLEEESSLFRKMSI